MNAYMKRLDKLATLSRGNSVCDACKREGQTETPYEHCISGEQCNRAHQVLTEWTEKITASFPPRALAQREADHQWVMELTAPIREKLRQEREAWAIKRGSQRGRVSP